MLNKLSNIVLHIRYGLKINKPLLLWRVAKSYLLAYIFPIPPLRYIDFAFDFACNLRCQHCFAVTLKKPGLTQLTIKDYQKIAREAEKIGVFHVSFQGGEPLLLPKKLEEIINAFNPKKFYISVTTNGTLLTKEKAVWLKKIGVDKISLSIDSKIPEEHDSFRQIPGTFNKAWKSIDFAQQAGLNVTINTCLTHQNLHSPGIQQLFEYAIKNRVIINPIFATPVGRWLNETKMVLSPKDTEYVTKLQRKSPYLRRDIDSNYRQRGCPAVKEVIYVDPYGNVLPCPFLHVYLGNLKKEHLDKVIKRSLKFIPFKKYSRFCLASEDSNFMEVLRKTYKKSGQTPFTLKDLQKMMYGI